MEEGDDVTEGNDGRRRRRRCNDVMEEGDDVAVRT